MRRPATAFRVALLLVLALALSVGVASAAVARPLEADGVAVIEAARYYDPVRLIYDAPADVAAVAGFTEHRATASARPSDEAPGPSLVLSGWLVAPKGSPSLWSRLADEAGSIPGSSRVDDLFRASDEWLGSNWRVIKNEAGDTIVLSDDGRRRLRFDINRPYPHQSPHAHVEEFVNGRWVKSGPLYPTDVPPR